MSSRIAVLVSGRGTNLQALIDTEHRGDLGGQIALVLADQACPAIDRATAANIPTRLLLSTDFADRAAWDGALCDTLASADVDLVVLAGFMRVVGTPVLDRFANRMINVHPSLLPAFPGRDAIGAALGAGVRVTGVTVHLVDATIDGGPILLQEPVTIRPAETRDELESRIHAVEHRLLPTAVRLMLSGAVSVAGGRAVIDAQRAATIPRRRRALLSVSDKTGLVELARGLDELDFELVSTGGTARALRDGGLPVTDVAAVTGFPEMLDGRVKTLHPRVHGGVLADWRNADHRAQLAAATIEPFELVVVNLYRFAEAAARPDIDMDELIEEIDIGGPTLVRAAAKNHANVAIVSSPGALRRGARRAAARLARSANERVQALPWMRSP